jgi:ATP-dependent DNA helicase RecQ
MPVDYDDFRNNCLLFDIEINEHGVVYAIGAVYGRQSFQIKAGRPVDSRSLTEFDEFAAEAEYLLGHNIISHDIPRLKQRAPFLKLLHKPAVDTLYLSPLAYPANPYHRLVKDYQIVRDSINDPVEDARLAGKVFEEQWQAFRAMLQDQSDIPVLYRSFLHTAADLRGSADSLAAMGVPLLEGEDLAAAFSWFAGKHGCVQAVEELVDQLHDGSIDTAVMAYVTAWLSVAGGNSVLPPWVRHTYPAIARLLHRLRERDCGDYHRCPYCKSHHDPRTFLQNSFGFTDFRAQPATADGRSLQEVVVTAAAENATLFATLPTGGGKSLCYLLPAFMRYQRRNMLTIVISPLQALMKDQVDNFSRQTGTRIAAPLYGLLTMVERGEIMESIRMGDVGILYVSPEQLRNHSFVKVISQREIGAWVFDEAHCLSKWGHDFRPDYLYAIRFIREFAAREKTAIPAVQCFTATAKKDVKAEITDIIQSELGLRVYHFAGGHERVNLRYDVYPVDKYEKNQVIAELLHLRYSGRGSVVIYCATRKNTENLAQFLQENGYNAEAFHAGLDNSLKKRLQEAFLQDEIPIICATNAFGMGIDKEDVRLVIHADIPGSLENYLQEAGRAGRDRLDAECILVFDEQDIEKQFELSSISRLSRREIGQMLRGIRYAAKGKEEVVLTAGELLRQAEVDLDPDAMHDPASRVRTAVAWLERAGFLQRNENNTRVFQGKPLVKDMAEAAEKISHLNLSERQQDRWLALLAALMQMRKIDSFSADELAALAPFAPAEEDGVDETETQRVIKTLHDMAEQGILSKETTLSAYIRHKVGNNGKVHLQRVCALEREFLKVLEELAPEADRETPLELDLRQVNQLLLDKGYEYSSPDALRHILHGLTRDGKGLAGQKGSISIHTRGGDRFAVFLQRDWHSLAVTMQIRQQAAAVALRVILGHIDPEEKANANLLVEFTLEKIVEGLQRDLTLLPLLNKPLPAAERALTFMHEQGILDLQQGLAVFNQAMTLHLQPQAKGKRYTMMDFAPLQTHYTERNFQIHVMNEYARQALDRINAAMHLVVSYFEDDKEDFINRFFPGRYKMLERATSEQSYQIIVDDLKNKNQQAIVAAPVDRNMLVLAGPGSGKTRVVVHRVAYLLRVERVNPGAILVLCFNRSAVMGLRRRLRQLAGGETGRVTTLTFHGLALRLTGRSLAAAAQKRDTKQPDFAGIIAAAIALLKGEDDVLGLLGESPRDALVGKFSHILVDEYQDIDEEQYELVSLLAGKSLEEHDQKMTIMAVGDDDQNIYHFRGANVGFIRRFQEDYGARIHYLIENYRSTANIIAASNSLIQQNNDRMKTDHPIEVNTARGSLPAGGNRQLTDPVGLGRVQRLVVASLEEQACGVLSEINRLQSAEGGLDLNSCAVLAREWKSLDPLRGVLEKEGLPVNFHWGRVGGFPSLTRIRENALLLEYLQEHRGENCDGATLMRFLPESTAADNIWQTNLRKLLGDWIEETHGYEQPAGLIAEYLYETLADQGRSRNLGNGVFLSTVHSVKGLEFDHVFLLGDNWQGGTDRVMEEERRLFYVGMSRARQTLHLLQVDGMDNPHAGLLCGDFLLERRLTPGRKPTKTSYRYALLGMEDLFLDFAGIKGENSPCRAALAALQCGDFLSLHNRDGYLELVQQDGIAVARLSHKARKLWAPRLEDIGGLKVVAMVRRYLDDVGEESYRKKCHGSMWEVPLVELTVHLS